MTIHVGIYLFDQVEVLDFAGPFEVFTTAARVSARSRPHDPPIFSVKTFGRESRPIRARAGLLLTPDCPITARDEVDLLIVPGGVVTSELERVDVIAWIEERAQRSKITASVCTGAFLLGRAGLLEGRKATTHWEDLDDLQKMFPSLTVCREGRWVDEGKIVTSAGISAGIDMSLHLVERLADRQLAERTARQMDFDWTGNAGASR